MDGKDGRRGRRRRRKVARRWVSKGGAKWSWYGERRCCVRPTQTGPRFKALRAAYLSLPSFFFLPATAVYHLRGPVIPSRLRVSDLHTHTHMHLHARPRGPPTRQYVRITARRRISFDHIPSLRIIGRATYGVFDRETRIVRSGV